MPPKKGKGKKSGKKGGKKKKKSAATKEPKMTTEEVILSFQYVNNIYIKAITNFAQVSLTLVTSK